MTKQFEFESCINKHFTPQVDCKFCDEEIRELDCSLGHECLSGCQKDYDCPCENHECSRTPLSERQEI